VPDHLVIGAGQIGKPLAERLADRGDTVTIASRSGSRARGAASVALDASDAAALSAAAVGVDTIFLCSNPPYTTWTTEWPPIFDAAIAAAAASGAGLVIMGNLYAYGTPSAPMTEHSPLATTETKGLVRKAGWENALAAHERGEIRAVEVRASDYYGPGAGATAHLGARFFEPLLASKTARVIGDPALTHSWSYLPDIVSTLVAAGDYQGAWGRAWHVPSNAPAARTEIADQVNERWGGSGRVAGIPQWMLRTLALVNPMMREVAASSYQFLVPFVIDSAETERTLGISATPFDVALTTTVESYRAAQDRD
jgi:nucleoside-diphosphate-sugar epimerase